MTPHSSKRLFGRLRETAILVDAFNRVFASGRSELVLISGVPGIGKSALAHRVRALIAQEHSRFAFGKCETLQDGVTLAALVQAVRMLIADVLGEGDDTLDAVRARLLSTLGAHGRPLLDLAPEAEVLTGRPPRGRDVPPALAQARLQRCFTAMFEAFAAPGRPLILLVDDVQWADPATLDVLLALAETPPQNVLIVLTLRSSEAGANPHKDDWLARLRATPLPMTEIGLEPLSVADTVEVLAQFGREGVSRDEMTRQASALHARTQGNPFFIEQLLRSEVADSEAAEVAAIGSTLGTSRPGDVRSFMTEKLQNLQPAQRAVVAALDIAGGHAELTLLAALARRTADGLQAAVQSLVEQGLLRPVEHGYGFSHDRVQEAARLLTPVADRPAQYARAARLMLAFGSTDRPGELLRVAGLILKAVDGDTVDHLRSGTRLRFATTLRRAAELATTSGSLEQAAAYIDAADALLKPSWWKDHLGLVQAIKQVSATSLMTRGRINDAEAGLAELLAHDLDPLGQAETYRLLAILRTVQSDYDGAIGAALSGLELLGHRLERWPTEQVCRDAAERIRAMMGDRPDTAFAERPLSDNPASALSTSLLSTLIVATFSGDRLLFTHVAKIVELTLAEGISSNSAYGLAWYGVMIAHLYDRHEDGFAYVQTALELVDRHGFEGPRTATLIAMDQLSPWTQPFRYALERVHDAIAAAKAAGDLAMSCYARNHLVSDLIQMGRPLDAVEKDARQGVEFARRLGFRDIEILIQAQHDFIRRMQLGDATEPREETDTVVSASTACWLKLYDGVAAYWFGDYAHAAKALAEADALAWSLPAHIDLAYLTLFSALNAARHEDAEQALVAIRPLYAKLSLWRSRNRETFEHRLLMVEAEVARLRGEPLQALRLLDEAIAASGDFGHERALAEELAGDLCQQEGLALLAGRYYAAAQYDYAAWGAEAKTAILKAKAAASGGVARGPSDLTAILASIRAMTGEIELPRLLQLVLGAFIDHAGAATGMLVLMKDSDPMIEAIGFRSEAGLDIRLSALVPTEDRIPAAMLNRLLRANEPVLDSLADTGLGVALRKDDVLVGMVYLTSPSGEMRRHDGQALMLLADHSAAALRVAQRHSQLLADHERKSQADAALRLARTELSRTAHLAMMGGLAASIAHEVNQPLASILGSADASLRWLRREVPDIDEAVAGLAGIRAGAERAAAIIASLRSLAKQDYASMEPLTLDAVIEDVVRLTQPEVEAQAVTLTCHLAAGQTQVMGDRVQLQQIVLNLVTNALDALSAQPRDSRALIISSTVEGATLAVRVEDTGGGIPPDQIDQIFMPLFTTKSKGMGMGLAIGRSIIEAHGGTLSARRRDVGGTCFTFVLPVLA
ncbi:hypothetical protein CA606_06335 [Caulobacter vibrioides]|uniref:histidine kinase n=1 Tax=Caulobacter vibrioides TaxID=155892 RepID=A0A290MIV8_CAUVI|nr:AAA family ATPase [Caulobacter vibrioides]ATC32003.1 hypothetical protein CA606_06335 [Caulobacter vibrioides]